MSADKVMKWSVEARNKIEKQGDLETYSEIKAEIIASYLPELPQITVKADLFEGVSDLLARVPKEALEKQVLEHGSLQIERRWVDNQLPESEILEALSYVYGQLSLLVDDAHRQMGLEHGRVVQVVDGELHPYAGDASKLEGRLPCMVASAEARTLLVSLKTGQPVKFETKTVTATTADILKRGEKYGVDLLLQAPSVFASRKYLAEYYFEMARRVFLADGYHQPMAFFLKGPKVIHFLGLGLESRGDKYLMMRHVANEVERRGADGLMLINEVWIGKPTGAYEYPADMADRREALSIDLAAADGERLHVFAMIGRRAGTVMLGETQTAASAGGHMFAPVQEVWARWR